MQQTFDIELKGLSPLAVVVVAQAIREVIAILAKNKHGKEGNDEIVELAGILNSFDEDLNRAAQIRQRAAQVPQILQAQMMPVKPN